VIDLTGACVGASVSGQIPHDLEQISLRATFGDWRVGYLYVFLHALFKTAAGLSRRKSAHELAISTGNFESTYSNVKASLSSHVSTALGACVGASVGGQIPHDLEQISLSSIFPLSPYKYFFLHALLRTETGLSKGTSAHDFASCSEIFEST